MSQSQQLDALIDSERNHIRTDKIDMTYGELASLYASEELVISPEYQRLFRWGADQKARFIESILLGFPIPAIFVAEDEKGIWELVDGLQRVSTMLEFIGVLKNTEGELVEPSRIRFDNKRSTLAPLLEGLKYEELTLRSRLSIKRAYCRVEVIKVGSSEKMKYEVFERLNTGGADLSPQEIRNCIFRATDPAFMRWIDELAEYPPYRDNLGISDNQKNAMYDRGLLLRFFTLKNNAEGFGHDVEPFITSYIRDVLEGAVAFDMDEEGEIFRGTFKIITDLFGDDSWHYFKDGKYKGSFSVYLFDALSLAVARNLDYVKTLEPDVLRERLFKVKTSSEFLGHTGAGGNTKARLLGRISVAVEILTRDNEIQ